jgi:hypothetical protein
MLCHLGLVVAITSCNMEITYLDDSIDLNGFDEERWRGKEEHHYSIDNCESFILTYPLCFIWCILFYKRMTNKYVNGRKHYYSMRRARVRYSMFLGASNGKSARSFWLEYHGKTPTSNSMFIVNGFLEYIFVKYGNWNVYEETSTLYIVYVKSCIVCKLYSWYSYIYRGKYTDNNNFEGYSTEADKSITKG